MTLKILKNHNSVTICINEDVGFLDGFLDIYVDEGDGLSPFQDIESAELFSLMIVKLLEAVHDFK